MSEGDMVEIRQADFGTTHIHDGVDEEGVLKGAIFRSSTGFEMWMIKTEYDYWLKGTIFFAWQDDNATKTKPQARDYLFEQLGFDGPPTEVDPPDGSETAMGWVIGDADVKYYK